MRIQVNLGTRKRKELAEAVGEIIGQDSRYQGAPTYAYEIGRVTVERDGTLSFESKHIRDAAFTHRLLEGLRGRGFAPEVIEGHLPQGLEEVVSDEVSATAAENAPEPPAETEPDKLVIQIPLEDFSSNAIENLRLLVASKATLIKKALKVSDLTIRQTEDTLDFPWFDTMPEALAIKVYTQFIEQLCNMAKTQTRIIAVEKPTDNDKFVMRLFLVRLGMKGDKYADARRILLRDLTGNGSVKDANAVRPTARVDSAEGAEAMSNSAHYPPERNQLPCRKFFRKFIEYLLSEDEDDGEFLP
ncbi:MAG: hypothetical protein LBS03_09320 [Bacteroidales bacterium]|jgi:hypothetical protein|nr:hypothetical protein [Bacteroidales bacterium]